MDVIFQYPYPNQSHGSVDMSNHAMTWVSATPAESITCGAVRCVGPRQGVVCWWYAPKRAWTPFAARVAV